MDADEQLRGLLGQALAFIKEHGARSEQIRALVQANLDVPEFPKLVAAMIFVHEVDIDDFLGRFFGPIVE